MTRAAAGERRRVNERTTAGERASEWATTGERRRRRVSDGGLATAGERAIGRRRAIDDGGPRTPGRRWRRTIEGAIDGAIDRACLLYSVNH